MKKLIPWLVVLVVLAGGGYGIWRWQKSHAAPELSWKTAPVEKKKIVGEGHRQRHAAGHGHGAGRRPGQRAHPEAQRRLQLAP